MALTKYDFVKETHLTLLTEEIEASATITVALDHLVFENGTTSVWFKAALSAGEQTELSNIVTAHDKDSYVAPREQVETVFTRQEDDTNIPYVYASPRPMNHYSYFTSASDVSGYGDGDMLLLNLTAATPSVSKDITFNEDVYLKDGLIMCDNAPFGAYVDIDIYHPLAGYLLSFGKKIPIFGAFPIQLNTEDRAHVPAGLIIRITVHNSDGTGGADAAADFRVLGRLELYRPKP